MSTDMSPSNKQLLLVRRNNDRDYSFRNFASHKYDRSEDSSWAGNVFTEEWIDLVEGELYYTETHVKQNNHDVHMTLGFELEPTDPAAVADNSPDRTPQYRKLTVNTELSRDTATLLITQPAGEEFNIYFQHPEENTWEFKSGDIVAGGPAADL